MDRTHESSGRKKSCVSNTENTGGERAESCVKGTVTGGDSGATDVSIPHTARENRPSGTQLPSPLPARRGTLAATNVRFSVLCERGEPPPDTEGWDLLSNLIGTPKGGRFPRGCHTVTAAQFKHVRNRGLVCSQ